MDEAWKLDFLLYYKKGQLNRMGKLEFYAWPVP